MVWGVSSVALYVPWAGGAGPWISVSLWLWLGVLDAVQGVGLGMILLQTLSRLHVCATLAFSQMLGSVVVIVARPTVPRQQVFPDFALWNVGDGFKHSPFASVPFWVALVCQILVVVGYFWYYRKEQLGTWYFVASIMRIFYLTFGGFVLQPARKCSTSNVSSFAPSFIWVSSTYHDHVFFSHPFSCCFCIR